MPAAIGFGNVLGSTGAGVTGAQGVPFTFTMPEGTWKFIFAHSLYVSDATPGLRGMALTIFDDAGVLQLTVGLGVQNPSSILRYTWQAGSAFSSGFGIIFQRNMPTGLILLGDWTMRFDATAAGPGDTQDVSFQLALM